MPKLSLATERTRLTQALNALQMIAKGAPKEEACAQVGLSEWQYDQWLAKDDGVLEAFQNAVVEAERIRMVNITNAQAIILSKYVKNVTAEDADPDTQLRALKYLDTLRDRLEAKHGVNTQADKAADYILDGPATIAEKSQMAVQHELSRSTINIKPREDGSMDLSIPVPTQVIDLLPNLADDHPQEEGYSPEHEEVAD